MRRKTAEMGERREVVYDAARWETFRRLRVRAREVLVALELAGLDALVFGSVARGDVRPASDVDLFVPRVVNSLQVLMALDTFDVLGTTITQATPRALVKAIVELEDNTTVAFPLIPPREVELEFYRFGGALGADGVLLGQRVPGVDKRLMLIEPTEVGHVETPLSDLSPGVVAKMVNVGQRIVEERTRVLERRADVGRTGVYLSRPVAPDESVEQVLADLIAEDPALRRRLASR
ncbi:MAG TPA: nucleotidyltransferase domain-containing protein [Methanocella sp.]|nr:nucleotidyltransferase domain-containing protein [Methanocella sp.]